jgi:cell division protein FtsI/penicillin-binding protein 2
VATPTILKKEIGSSLPRQDRIPIEDAYYDVVHDGMRMVVTEGTAQSLNHPDLPVAAKTGTAQIKGNTRVNSWVIGFFPSDAPRYAFTVLMEDGPKVSSGAAHAFKHVVQYLAEHPETLPLQ